VNFAEAVRTARVSSGITQQVLAERSGCSIHAIWEIEQGNGTVALLSAVLASLNVRIAGLPRGSTLPERVRTARERRGWSIEKLAIRAEVSAMAVRRLEQGNARIATLQRVAACLLPNARVRKPNITSSETAFRDDWFTPADFMTKLVAATGSIDLDPCGHRESPVSACRYYYLEDDGLNQPWAANTIYVNPPYSRCADFIRRAHAAWTAEESRLIVMLLPVRIHQRVFHDEVVGSADVFFLKGKLTFERIGPPLRPAPFGSMLVIYGATADLLQRVLQSFDCVHLAKNAAVGRVEQRLQAA
jgi:phage N-6-adenine-methyltransferase